MSLDALPSTLSSDTEQDWLKVNRSTTGLRTEAKINGLNSLASDFRDYRHCTALADLVV